MNPGLRITPCVFGGEDVHCGVFGGEDVHCDVLQLLWR